MNRICLATRRLYSCTLVAVTLVWGLTSALAETAPDFEWTLSGNAGSAYAAALDSSGNLYVAGTAQGKTSLRKYDPAGTLLWSSASSGSSSGATGVAVDGSDNVYVAGWLVGSLTLGNTTLTTKTPQKEIFLAKYSPSGALLWATSAGGLSADMAFAVSADTAGNAYVAGYFSGTPTYPARFGSIIMTSSTAKGTDFYSDAFLAKYDPSGKALWVKKTGNAYDDTGLATATDKAGNVYVAGQTIRPTVYQVSGTNIIWLDDGGMDLFVSKYNSAGTLLWSQKSLGVSAIAHGVAVDNQGNVFITGEASMTNSLGSFPLNVARDANTDIFIAKCDSAGNVLWVRQAGGAGLDAGSTVAVDNAGNAFVTGRYVGTAKFGATTLTNSGYSALFVAKYDGAGNLGWVKPVFGASDGHGLATAGDGPLYVCGDSQMTLGKLALPSSPRILTQPTNQPVLAGMTARFTVTASGTPPLTYRWQKDGVDLTNGSRISGADTASLIIVNVQPEDRGSYTARVVSPSGSAASMPALLVISDLLPPTLVVTSHSDYQLVGASTVSLTGIASDAGSGDNGISSVTVNGMRASNDTAVASAPATWNRSLTLTPGTNTLKLVATDTRGNAVTNLLHLLSDTVQPRLTITTPLPNQRWSNAVLTVRGTDSDNLRLAEVRYQLDGGAWLPAISPNSGSNWTADLRLQPGANTLKAWARDAAGNVSLTSSVSFVYVQSDRLQLQLAGQGALSPSYSNALLELGKTYTLTATPGAGYVFSNWTGGIFTNSTKLSFVMRSNLLLQANFVPNPFPAVKGTYNGLLTEGTRRQETSGFLTLSVTDRGSYSGSLQLGDKPYRFSGQFDVAGQASNTLLRPGTNALNLTLGLNLTPGLDHLGGTLTDGQWLSKLWAERAVYDSRTNPAPYAGKYTLILPGSNTDASAPAGDVSAAVSVDAAGRTTLTGSLADGTAFSQTVPLCKNGAWPLYASLYGGKGSVFGWLTFDTNQPPDDLHGVLTWIKQAQPTAKYYPVGFTNQIAAEGSHYTAPLTATNQVIRLNNGFVSFEEGNLSVSFTNQVKLSSNKILNQSSNPLTLTLSLPNGLFSGSVTVPGTKQRLAIKGALFQNADVGYGYCLGTNQSSRVLLAPLP